MATKLIYNEVPRLSAARNVCGGAASASASVQICMSPGNVGAKMPGLVALLAELKKVSMDER